MLFNSYAFIFLMMPISIIGYYLINRISYKGGMLFLLVCSFGFIGYTNRAYLMCLIPSILFNYAVSIIINNPKADAGLRKGILATGVSVNVLILGIFKYADFFIDNINIAFQKDYVLLRLLLPLGISFYTFQQISYIVDCYRDKDLRCSLLEYSLYISFYPQFIQGPIVLQSEFIPQIRDESRKNPDFQLILKGLYRFSFGLAKKVLIADGLAKVVDGGYSYLDEVGALSALMLILGYSLQIYFDFSAYSDMAVGLGLMFHIELPENFNSPYKASSIDEFWDRWHITLTRFFTRYIYIPLGGSRRGNIRTYVNIFVIFLISGFWHGAEWSFAVWGLMHGVAMIVSRLIRNINSGKFKKAFWSKLLGKVITFTYVCSAWVFFRAADIPEALKVFRKLGDGNWRGITVYMYEAFSKLVEISWLLRLDVLELRNRFQGLAVIVSEIMLLAVCLLARNSTEITEVWNKKPKLKYALSVAGLTVWSILSFSGVNNYIYWNF